MRSTSPSLVSLAVSQNAPTDFVGHPGGPPEWYVDAFLDRGPRGKDSRLHMLCVPPNGGYAEPCSHASTRMWNAHEDRKLLRARASVITVTGNLLLANGPTMARAALQTFLLPHDRIWGQLAKISMPSLTTWYTAEGLFVLPSDIRTLPRIRDVLRDPSDILAPHAPALAAKHEALPQDRQNDARFVPVYGYGLSTALSAHLVLAALTDLRHSLSCALQTLTHAGGKTDGMDTDHVPLPVWSTQA